MYIYIHKQAMDHKCIYRYCRNEAREWIHVNHFERPIKIINDPYIFAIKSNSSPTATIPRKADLALIFLYVCRLIPSTNKIPIIVLLKFQCLVFSIKSH